MKVLIAYLATLALMIGTLTPLNAEVISSEEILSQAHVQLNKENVLAAINSSEVQQKLIELGVEPDQAKARIDAMTPSELAQLNEQLEDMPAGGVVGTVVTVFVVLFILDALGVTDVFDFIDPI